MFSRLYMVFGKRYIIMNSMRNLKVNEDDNQIQYGVK